MLQLNSDNYYNLKKSLYFEQFYNNTFFVKSESWIVLLPIEQQIKDKIELIGTPLKEWNISINYGIKTGFNEAFIINGDKRRELIDLDSKSDEIIRPILRGRDIKRYNYEFADLWLINTHNGVKEKEIKPINVNDYPAVKKHLDEFYIQLEKRTDKGDTPYNLRSCAYVEDFDRPKIVYPNMTKFLPFIYDEEGFLTNQKCFIITGENTEFLTAFLNSSLFKFCFRDSFPELQGGTRELSKIFFDKISVLKVSENINLKFKELITEAQRLRKKGEITREIEVKIDNMIYDLYDFSESEKEEVGFIEIQ